MNSEGLEQIDIIERYVSICNVALDRNSERFPFKQILDAAEKTSHGRMIEVEISDWPEIGTYVFTLSKGRIKAEKHDCGGECKCDGKLDFKKSYLEDVIRNAGVYIDNPAKINWDWLYH